MKRVAALLAAAGMIAAAVLVRGWLDQRDQPGGGSSPASGDQLTLVCVTELEAVCVQLARNQPGIQVRTEDVATTIASLSASDADASAIDGWLTFAPFPELVDEQRARAGLQPILADPTAPLARSPLVMAVWNDRRAVLETACPAGGITWRCVGELAGRPWVDLGGGAAWGAVKPGQPTPDRTAAGWLALAQAAGSWFGRTDFAANDFQVPAFRRWFEQLERGVPSYPPPPRTPLEEMLSKGPATFDMAASTEAAAAGPIARSRVNDQLSIIYPSPLSTADVVLAPVAGSDGEARLRRLVESGDAADALTGQGWRVDGQPPAGGVPGEPPLPPDSGLPRAGVLQALRTLWIEVIR